MRRVPISLHVRTAEPGDLPVLVCGLRAADVRELEAASGETAEIVLEAGMGMSEPCLSLIGEGDLPIAIFGVVPDPAAPDVGLIWFVASEALMKHGLLFLRHSRAWIEKLEVRYRVLWNWVDARNTEHLRWLLWCGFQVEEREEQHGSARVPFYRVRKVRSSA
jgi:hypothetical protein